MTSAIVQDDGTGPVTGTVDGGVLSATVNLSNSNDAGVLGWHWEIVYKPIGSSASLSGVNSTLASFSPDVRGTYLLRLSTYLDASRTSPDAVSEECYAVRLVSPFDWRVPAAGETGQYDNPDGWATAREESIRDIHSRVNNPAPANLQVGALLWEWNGEDTTQFQTSGSPPSFKHRNDLGSMSGSGVLSVVDLSPLAIGKVLRVTATSLVGGYVFPLELSELDLPSRYVVVVNFADASSQFLAGGLYPFFLGDGNDEPMIACALHRRQSAGNLTVYAVVDDLEGADTIASSGAMTTTADTVERGGITSIVTVDVRPSGETPALGQIRCEDRNGNGGWAHDGSVASALSGVGTTWNGQDMNRIGIGIYNGGGALSASFDFGHLAIYAHPED